MSQKTTSVDIENLVKYVSSGQYHDLLPFWGWGASYLRLALFT